MKLKTVEHTPNANDILVCMPVKSMPVPIVPAAQGTCSICGEAIWVTRSSPQGPRRICALCVTPERVAGAQLGLTEKQLDEIPPDKLEKLFKQ